MKIGFVGNANNYPLMLARAMRRAGHEVVFVVHRPEPLNRPEHRYDDLVPYPDWIHEVPGEFLWSFLSPGPGRKQIIELMRGCDAVLLNLDGVSLATEIRRPHIALLSGADLTRMANPAYTDHAKSYRRAEQEQLARFVAAQRAGIQSAVAVSYFPPGVIPGGDALLADLDVLGDRRLFVYLADTDFFVPQPPPENPQLRIFCPARLTWIRERGIPSSEDYKGSDIMIRGLALFAQNGPPFEIHLPRKGKDVLATQSLIEELSLQDHVKWFDEKSQSELFLDYQRADIVFDQLGQSMPGMSTLDALALGRPVIANGRPDLFTSLLGRPLPVLQASTAEEVAERLRELSKTTTREAAGRLGREFVEKYLSAEGAGRLCLEKLGAVVRESSAGSQWRSNLMQITEDMLDEHDSRLRAFAAELDTRELKTVDSEWRWNVVLERETAVLRQEIRLASLQDREGEMAAREGQAAAREAACSSRERAVLAREEAVAEQERYLQSLPGVRQIRGLRRWWKTRKAGGA